MKPKTEFEPCNELKESIERLMHACTQYNFALKLEVSTTPWSGCIHLKRSPTEAITGPGGKDYIRDELRYIKELVGLLGGTIEARINEYGDI